MLRLPHERARRTHDDRPQLRVPIAGKPPQQAPIRRCGRDFRRAWRRGPETAARGGRDLPRVLVVLDRWVVEASAFAVDLRLCPTGRHVYGLGRAGGAATAAAGEQRALRTGSLRPRKGGEASSSRTCHGASLLNPQARGEHAPRPQKQHQQRRERYERRPRRAGDQRRSGHAPWASTRLLRTSSVATAGHGREQRPAHIRQRLEQVDEHR